MSIQLPALFEKAKYIDTLTVAQVYNSGNLKLPLSRGASLQLRQEKQYIFDVLLHHDFQWDIEDDIIWELTAHKTFTVHSLYLFLNCRGVLTPISNSIWVLKVPLKVKVFGWLVGWLVGT